LTKVGREEGAEAAMLVVLLIVFLPDARFAVYGLLVRHSGRCQTACKSGDEVLRSLRIHIARLAYAKWTVRKRKALAKDKASAIDRNLHKQKLVMRHHAGLQRTPAIYTTPMELNPEQLN